MYHCFYLILHYTHITSSSHHLAMPRIRLSTVGKRAFAVSGATVWNDLPPHVTSAPSLAICAIKKLLTRSYLPLDSCFSNFFNLTPPAASAAKKMRFYCTELAVYSDEIFIY